MSQWNPFTRENTVSHLLTGWMARRDRLVSRKERARSKASKSQLTAQIDTLTKCINDMRAIVDYIT